MLTDLLSLSSTDLMSLSSTDLLSPGSQRGCDIVTTGEFVQVIAILPDHVVVRKAHPAEIMPTPARLPAGHLVASTILLHAKAEQPGGKEISRVGRQMIETKRLSAPWMNPMEPIPESSHTSTGTLHLGQRLVLSLIHISDCSSCDICCDKGPSYCAGEVAGWAELHLGNVCVRVCLCVCVQ